MKLSLEPIGYIRSPYKEKFSVPRQPGLVASAVTRLEFSPPFDSEDFVDGLSQFSHCWLIFAFHQNQAAGWKAKVRPPRLGGNQKIGVFATRSSFRPNNLGMSALEIIGITQGPRGTVLELKGGDLVDGTPIYDLKPYLSYADAIPEAEAGYAQRAPNAALRVTWTDAANLQSDEYALSPSERALIEEVLSQDPRPSYKRDKLDEKAYAVKLLRFDVHWRVLADKQTLEISSLSLLDE